MFKKSKRGETDYVLFIALEIIIAVIVIAMFLNVVKSWTNGDVANKVYIARDTALLIDSLYSAPYDVYVVYPSEASVNNIISRYTLSFKDGKASVYSGNLDATKASYRYVENGKTNINEEFINPKVLYFYKINNVVGVTNDENIIRDMDFANMIDTKEDITKKKFVIYPVNDNLGKDSIYDIAEPLADAFSQRAFLARSRGEILGQDADKTVQRVVDENSPVAMVISLMTLSEQEDKKIVIQTPEENKKDQEIRKISALLEKNFKDNNDLKDISVEITKTNEISLFNNNKDKIIFQINVPLNKDPSIIVNIIRDSILEYYR